METYWQERCPLCDGEVDLVTTDSAGNIQLRKHGRQLDMSYGYMRFECTECGHPALAMRKSGDGEVSYKWRKEPVEWDTPNDPDGIELDVQEVQGDGGVLRTMASWRDPETGVRVVFEGRDRHEVEKQARLEMFRRYGDRVIRPEHRGGEF